MTDQSGSPLAATTYAHGHISLMSRPFGAPRFHLSEAATSAPASGGEGGGDAPAPDAAMIAPAGTGTDISISQAARALQSARRQKERGAVADAAGAPAAAAADQEHSGDGADQATADTELSGEDNAAPGESPATGETQEAAPAEKPLRELPRSWTKDRAEYWNKLDPETQDFLLEQDSKASKEVRRIQNEAAEKLKGLTAKEQAAEKAQQNYEGKLKSVVGMLEGEQLRDFPDIRSVGDLERMTAEMLAASDMNSPHADPLKALQLQGRLRAWDVHQAKLQAAHQELDAAETRQRDAKKSDWTKHLQTENELAAKAIPDLADPEKAPVLHKRAFDRLVDLGFTQEELNSLADGSERISIYDHRLQQLIFSDLKFGDLQRKIAADDAARKAAIAKAAGKDVPPVQRPGTPAPRGGDASNIQSLTQKLTQSGNFKDALALHQARQRAAAGRRTS